MKCILNNKKLDDLICSICSKKINTCLRELNKELKSAIELIKKYSDYWVCVETAPQDICQEMKMFLNESDKSEKE